jgi:hypothetical protein
MIRWPEWLSDESSCLQAPEQTRGSEKPAPEQFDLIPIGVIRKKAGKLCYRLNLPATPALKQLEFQPYPDILVVSSLSGRSFS